MKISLLSFIFFIFASQAWSQSLTCKALDATKSVWNIYNGKNIIIGSMHGFGNKSICESLKATQSGNLVCSWNGYSYQPYNATNGVPLGKAQPSKFYDQFNDCHEHIKNQKKDSMAVCAWSGDSFSVFKRLDNVKLTEPKGWGDIKDCIDQSVNNSFQNLSCTFLDGYYLVHLNEGTVASPKFKLHSDCNSFLDFIKSKKIKKNFSDELNKLFLSKDYSAFRDGVPNKKIGFTFKQCEDAEYKYHLTKNNDGYLVDECKPDTLYSWGGFDKMQWFKDNLNSSKSWPSELPRSLYTVPFPATTFGYGVVPLRFKIKNNVKFKILISPVTNLCENFKANHIADPSEFKDTIFSRVEIFSDGSSFQEYIICSADVIESWSVGTQEHFDEIIRDDSWLRSEHYYNWEGFYKIAGVDEYLNSTIDSNVSTYATDFSPSTFAERMIFLKAFTVLIPEKIETRPNEKTLGVRHFKTKTPIYFNPD